MPTLSSTIQIMRSNLGLPEVIAAPLRTNTERAAKARVRVAPAQKFLLHGREPDVLLDVSRERSSRRNLNFLAVLDQSDGTEKHRKGDRSADFTIALAALGASKPDVVIGHGQILQLNIKFAAFAHHPRTVSVRDDCFCMRAFCHDDGLTHFNVVIEKKLDGVVF